MPSKPQTPSDPSTDREAQASGSGALSFVHDQPELVRRFMLAELLAPPLALRGRQDARNPKRGR